MKGALTPIVTPGAGSVDAWKQRLGLDFHGDDAKSTASGPEPGLTDFDDVRTGWAEIRDEEDSFMRGWRWRWSLPVVAAGAGRGCAGRGKKS